MIDRCRSNQPRRNIEVLCRILDEVVVGIFGSEVITKRFEWTEEGLRESSLALLPLSRRIRHWKQPVTISRQQMISDDACKSESPTSGMALL